MKEFPPPKRKLLPRRPSLIFILGPIPIPIPIPILDSLILNHISIPRNHKRLAQMIKRPSTQWTTRIFRAYPLINTWLMESMFAW